MDKKLFGSRNNYELLDDCIEKIDTVFLLIVL